MNPPVAIVLNTLGLGGVPEVAVNLLRHLPENRYRPLLFILKHAPSEEDARQALLSRITDLGAEVYIAESDGGRLGVVAELADWLEQQRVAIVHTHSYRPNLYGRLAGVLCRPKGLRIVAHYHNEYDDKWSKQAADLSLERHLAKHTDAMLAVSGSVREHVAERVGLNPERIELMLNGIDHARFQCQDREAARAAYRLPPQAIAIGIAGRICAQKGQDDFLEAAATLAAENPDLYFLMAGNAEDRSLTEHLHNRIAVTGLQDRARLLGHEQDMPRFYAALDILAAPSRWEGFGLMLAEAMAAGVPIVASRVGAIPEVVQENRNALLVPPSDPVALAQALKRLATDADLRKRLGDAGPEQAARFSWERTGRQLDQLYQRLLQTGETPWG